MKDIILEMNILFQKSNQTSTVFINDRDQATSELPSNVLYSKLQNSSHDNLALHCIKKYQNSVNSAF
jgi:hypothetical protein